MVKSVILARLIYGLFLLPFAAAVTLRSPQTFKAKGAPDIWDTYHHNQQTRAGIKEWMNSPILHNSVLNYGVAFPTWKLAADVGQHPIQHDLISQLGARLQESGQKLRYLEIGTSVLKNFHTQSHSFHDAIMTGFDIEDPNPIIEDKWPAKHTVRSWSASPLRAQKHRSLDFINSYSGPQSNSLYYMAADALATESYVNLNKTIVSKYGPMNFILSDALHTGEAVTTEVTNLLAQGIIQQQQGQDFVMLWDDCGSDGHDNTIKAANLQSNFPRLRQVFAGRKTCSGSVVMPGWIGQNFRALPVCIFTTLDVSGPHLQASSSWTPQSNDVTCS